jgi:hypothetical protein
MKGKSVLKAEEGKLVKVFLDYDYTGEGKAMKINTIKITGDFFMHPEEGIEMLEKELIGAEMERNALLKRMDDFFRRKKIKLFGIASESLATAILNCKEETG